MDRDTCHDWDLMGCLDNNPQDYTLENVAEVMAVWEGENDGDNWRWILRLDTEKFVYLIGGCDYTGWDCQSFANSTYADTAEAAARVEIAGEDEPRTEVYDELLRQLAEGKRKTWHETQWEKFEEDRKLPPTIEL